MNVLTFQFRCEYFVKSTVEKNECMQIQYSLLFGIHCVNSNVCVAECYCLLKFQLQQTVKKIKTPIECEEKECCCFC